MTTCRAPLAALLMLSTPLWVFAQASSVPPPIEIAPVAPAGKPPPRLLTPSQTRDSATQAGDIRPERPVTPQIRIPFGKTPPPPSKSETRAVERGSGRSLGGVDDESARCEAQVGEQVRAKCRDKIARDARARPPG